MDVKKKVIFIHVQRTLTMIIEIFYKIDKNKYDFNSLFVLLRSFLLKNFASFFSNYFM